MPITLKAIDLKGLRWRPQNRARVWFVQLRPNVPEGEFPLVPLVEDGHLTALEVLTLVYQYDVANFSAPGDAPSIILLPELCLHPRDIEAVRIFIGAARPNTLFVMGAGQMSEERTRELNVGPLWADRAEGRYANCAIVGIGGSTDVYYQPKIVPSRWERDSHWAGSVVQVFAGEFVKFIVVICSELMGRPEDATTMAEIVEELRRRRDDLNLVIWIQHNPDPRSKEFNDSLEQLRYHEPTVLIGSSGSNRERRLKNYGVSGAIVPTASLPSGFQDLDRRFHYVEPLTADVPMSRIVLLRYEADICRVETVLADAVRTSGGSARGEVFHQSFPYVLDGRRIVHSNANVHLDDISKRALKLATATLRADQVHVESVRRSFVELGTAGFLGCLDVAIVPRPQGEDGRHAAGAPHPGGDAQCRCWDHRQCIDVLADLDAPAEPFADVMVAAAAISRGGYPIRAAYNRDRRSNFSVTLRGRSRPLAIVSPLDLNGDAARRAIKGGRETPIDTSYVVLGPEDGRFRRAAETVDVTQASPYGGLDVSRAVSSMPRAVYARRFWRAVEAGTIEAEVFARLFSE